MMRNHSVGISGDIAITGFLSEHSTHVETISLLRRITSVLIRNN
jgi:hypothetical protein